MSKVFLYKEKSDDRDCVAYIDIKDLKEAHVCIDGRFNIEGACYSCGLKEVAFENIDTILTESEYKTLCNYTGEDLTDIINKLLSEENQKLFAKIRKEETEYLMDEYGLTEDDIEQIFDEYGLEYRDRGVVGCVFKDTYDLGEEEAWSLGIIDTQMEKHGFPYERYFNYEQFGADLIDNDKRYIQLEDKRVVCLNY